MARRTGIQHTSGLHGWLAVWALALHAVSLAGCHSCHHARCHGPVAGYPVHPAYATNAALSHLQYGPAFAGDTLSGPQQSTATERLLEFKVRMEGLEKTNAGLKQDLEEVRAEVNANEKAFAKVKEELVLAADDLASTRSELATWRNTTEEFYRLMRESRNSELNELVNLESTLTALVTKHTGSERPTAPAEGTTRGNTLPEPQLAPIIDAKSAEQLGIGGGSSE